MKVWITKYALSSGIALKDVDEPDTESPGMITVFASIREAFDQHFHGEGREWHRTEEGARARAEKMRQDKIASLRKSIAKLEKLKF